MDRHKEELLQNILRSHSYRYPNETYRDVHAAISHYQSLKHIGSELYTSNDGVTKSLLRLGGTLPISFLGAKYNIPVNIWIMEDHPAVAPTCYVVPTQSMVVKPSANVNANGLVFHPYLQQWNFQSDLITLIRNLREVFGREPPVYARSNDDSSSGQPQTQPAARPGSPVMPLRERDIVVTKIDALARLEQEELEQTLADSAKLGQGEAKLKDLLQALQRDVTATETTVSASRTVNERLREQLQTMAASAGTEAELERMVAIPNGVHAQLVQCVAEHDAIDDTVYYLSKALACRAIQLGDFLQHVRELSRRQFIMRATIKKARAAAGLPPA